MHILWAEVELDYGRNTPRSITASTCVCIIDSESVKSGINMELLAMADFEVRLLSRAKLNFVPSTGSINRLSM